MPPPFYTFTVLKLACSYISAFQQLYQDQTFCSIKLSLAQLVRKIPNTIFLSSSHGISIHKDNFLRQLMLNVFHCVLR